MKNRKIAFLIFLMMASALLLSACNTKPLPLEEAIVGQWDNKTFTGGWTAGNIRRLGIHPPKEAWVEFTQDGKMVIMLNGDPMANYILKGLQARGEDQETIDEFLAVIPDFTYSVAEEKVIILEQGDGVEYDAKMEGKTMTLTSPDQTLVFTRRK